MAQWVQKASSFSGEFKSVEGSDTVFQLAQYAAMYLAATREGAAAKKWGDLAQTLSTVRTVGRWTGMLDTGLWVLSEAQHPSERDPVAQGLQMGRAVSIWVYYPLEHLWFLDSIGLIKLRDGAWYSRASCKMWGLYIALTLLQVLYKAYRSGRVPTEASLIDFTKNLCDFPLSIHWSLQDGCLSDRASAILGIAGSLIQVANRWLRL